MAKRSGVHRKQEALLSRLGVTVKHYRRKLGITQEELAWRANLHRTYIADIERGARNITLRSMGCLADALELPAECLLRESGEGILGPLKKTEPPTVGEILLIEDNPADATLTLRAFERARFSNPIKVLQDGEQAIQHLFGDGETPPRESNPVPQLILLDLNLPKMSGIDVLRRIKSENVTKQIPVIVLTASRHDLDIIECARLGAENYIIKPVSFDGLCRVTPNLSLRWALLKPANGSKVRHQQDVPEPAP